MTAPDDSRMARPRTCPVRALKATDQASSSDHPVPRPTARTSQLTATADSAPSASVKPSPLAAREGH